MKHKSTILVWLLAALAFSATVFAKNRITVHGNINSADGLVIGNGSTTIRPSANIVNRSISVGDFNKVDVSFVKLIIKEGTPDGIAKLSAPDNLIDKVRIRNHNGKLDIGLEGNIKIRGKADITVEITAAALGEIDAELSATVNIPGILRCGRNLELSASTSGSVKAAKVMARSCEIDAETSGIIRIGELVADANVELNSETSGIVKIDALTCTDLEAEAETSASVSADITAVQSADLEAETAGSVRLTGATIQTGSAKAETAGSIKCSIANPTRIKHDTGGHVTNN